MKTRKANNKKLDAMKIAGEMMHTKMNETPTEAREYLRFLSQKYGFCGEVCVTAFAHYAQAMLGAECNDVAYMIDDEGKKWFKDNT